MMKLFRSVFILICSVLSTSVFADNAWYVSIPSSKVDPDAPFNQRFQYTSVLYLTEQGLKSKLPLNYNCSSGCWVGVNTQNYNNPNDARYLDPEQENVYFKGTTVGDALTALYNRVGSMVYTSSATAPDRRDEGIVWCGAVGISTSGSGASYRVLNGGECGALPPPDLACSLVTPDVLLDHGTISAEEVESSPNNTIEGHFQIKCNRQADVLLAIISADEQDSDAVKGTRIVFKDGGGLVSYLRINDTAALTPTEFHITDPEGTNFKVTSELKVEGDRVIPGPFTSYAYIVLSYN